MTSLSVGELVNRHEQSIRAASPQPSPPPQLRSPTLTRNGTKELPKEAPTSPSPITKTLPEQDSLLAPPPSMPSSESTPAPTAPAEGADAPAQNGNGTLDDIQEDEAPPTAEAGEVAAAASAGADDQADGAPAAPAAEGGAAPQVEDAPLAAIAAAMPGLADKEREVVRANLERIAGYPVDMPLSASWTLHFSDTSGASKSSSAAATKDAYTEGISRVFTVTTVPDLCGSLKAFKKAVRRKNARPTDPDGLGLNRAGQNLHFFRTGISPTWEDPYNEKGGRITISPPNALFDAIYERLVLLIAGASLEIQAAELLQNAEPAAAPKKSNSTGGMQPGMIMGVVASRRARGDRIELWLGGAGKREPTPTEWLDRLREVLAAELEDPALRNVKFKRHF